MNNIKNTVRDKIKTNGGGDTIVVTKTVDKTEVVFKKKLAKVNELLSKTVFKK